MAREIAKEQGLPLTYEVADLNSVQLHEKQLDLVVAQTCLHHVLFLEHVADQIWCSLKSDGYLFEILLLLDHLCIEEEIVQPTGGQYLMRPRSVEDIQEKNFVTE